MKVKIGDVSDLIRGVSYKKTDANEASTCDDDILVLRGGNIQDGKIFRNANDEVFVDKSLVSEKQYLKKGDVVIVGSTGSSNLIGKAAIVENDFINISFGAFLMLIRPRPIINPKYFDYYFLSAEYRNAIRDLSVGVNINNIRKEYIENLEINCPPLPEQERIVAKLDNLFAHLETAKQGLEKIPVLLKQFRQAVLTQAVTGKLTEEWREGNELGEWSSTSIGSIYDIKTGSTPNRSNINYYQNGKIPWIKSGQVKNEFIYEADEFITELAIKESNAKIFPIDTLLVAMYGEGKTRGQVGWLKIEATTNQAIAALVNEELPLETKKYTYLYCLSQYEEIRKKAEGGNQPNLNLSKIKEWEINIPPFEEQTEIVRRVEALFSKADAIEAQYKKLKEQIDQLPQAILAKAFRGEV
jgi:type I restriction enzyme S subunit